MQVQHPGVNGQTLTVKIDNVTIDRPKKMKVVFYNYLTEVEHKEPAGDLFGYITVRDILSKNKPIPQTYEEAQRDPMTILYEPAHTSCYRRLYDALREIVDMNRR